MFLINPTSIRILLRRKGESMKVGLDSSTTVYGPRVFSDPVMGLSSG